MNDNHYTVTVYAGSDMYTQMRAPITVKDKPELEYDVVSQQLQRRIKEEFGEGAALVRRVPGVYDINVDNVPVS